MPRGERRVLSARAWAALLVLFALLGMARLAPSSASFTTNATTAIRSVVGAARQPEAIVERSTNGTRLVSADLDAAAVPVLVGLSIALWALLTISDLARKVHSRPPALLRLRGPPLRSC
jgi:hypothetical protein